MDAILLPRTFFALLGIKSFLLQRYAEINGFEPPTLARRDSTTNDSSFGHGAHILAGLRLTPMRTPGRSFTTTSWPLSLRTQIQPFVAPYLPLHSPFSEIRSRHSIAPPMPALQQVLQQQQQCSGKDVWSCAKSIGIDVVLR